jgi:hypothetical protein
MPLSGLARIVVLLTLAAIFVRALVPIGFMPDMTTGETFKIQICHGADIKTIAVGGDMTPINNDSRQTTQAAECAFAPMASSSNAFDTPLWLAFVLTAFFIVTLPRSRGITPRMAISAIARPRAPPLSL